MRISRLRLHDGEHIPAWYGVSYVDYAHAWTVCYPVPINLLVRAGSWLQMSFIFYCNRRAWDVKLKDARDAGFADGFATWHSLYEDQIQVEVNKRLKRAIEVMRQEEIALRPRTDLVMPENIDLNEGYST